ncbi:MAG TPA: HD domain-containing phosphohydrolase [Candidatus Omnitrophota bacterium]|nr:HD domain-containing phosphohydrolase [Candidatus Omnitrophota bacterium]
MKKKKKIHKRRVVGSIENASLLRKFSILFLLMSFIPTVVLYYFYVQLRDYGQITISEENFNLTMIFVVLGVILGYFTMRSALVKLVNLILTNRELMEESLSPSEIEELTKEKNELNVLAEAFKIITKRMDENVRSLELAKRTLHSVLSKVGQGMTSLENIDSFLDLIVETVTDALNGNVGVLMLKDKNELYVKTVYGVKLKPNEDIRLKLEKGTTIHTVISIKQPLIMEQAISDLSEADEAPHLFEPPLICAPMVTKDEVLGVILVSGRKDHGRFDEEEKNLLFNLASQTAIAIQNAQLNKDIEKTYFETITALALAIDAKDKYSRGHLDRVAKYCVMMGEKLGLDEEDIKSLRDAARLHDIGKIGIPDEVLNKEGKLTEQEKDLMKRHTEIGESIIKPVRSLHNLCDLIRHHHEKLDGSGYPDSLKGDEISPLVRILEIADIFDALTTDRAYRNRFTKDAACDILRSMRNELDQDLVEAFIEVLEGQKVPLS